MRKGESHVFLQSLHSRCYTPRLFSIRGWEMGIEDGRPSITYAQSPREEICTVKSRIRLMVIAVLAGFVLSTAALAQSSARKTNAAPPDQGLAQSAPEPDDAGSVKPSDAAPKAPPGQYKIGVVDRAKAVLGYKKAAAQFEQIKNERDEYQKVIDKVSERIQKAKDDYEATRKDMTPTQQAQKEAEIQKEFGQYQRDLDEKQQEIDSKMMLLRKEVDEKFSAAINKVGAEGGYHIIFGTRSVLYFSSTIDMTQKIIDMLNSGDAKQ